MKRAWSRPQAPSGSSQVAYYAAEISTVVPTLALYTM